MLMNPRPTCSPPSADVNVARAVNPAAAHDAGRFDDPAARDEVSAPSSQF